MDVVLRARRVMTADGEKPRCVGVRDGRIETLTAFDAPPEAARVIELDEDEVLLPGLVDSHVHVNDPGRSEWEGFETATKAAAAGGITTIIDMPLNSIPPTVTAAALDTKRAAAKDRVYVDVGFWGGAVPDHLDELTMLHEAGVFGFKCFLVHSGVDEFPAVNHGELETALATVGTLGSRLLVHAEDAAAIENAPVSEGRKYAGFLRSRPRGAENSAIAAVIAAAMRTAGRAHILHLSSSDAISSVAAARRHGIAVTAETCPHYLSFTAEEIPDGATQFKCCPPIREAENRELLWRGLVDGVIDCVVSDHSPCTPELKRFDTGDFGAAWGGIAGLQLSLPSVWTQARQRGIPLADVARWMATTPAELAGIRRKGRITEGADADFCVFAPDETFLVDAGTLLHRNPISAYHGRPLAGVVRSTWLRGKEITNDRPRGELLVRDR